MRRLTLVMVALMLPALPAIAQHGDHSGKEWLDEGTVAAARELGGSLLRWARNDVLPELRAWKAQLDGSLSPSDLAKLDELRQQAAALRERRFALATTMRDAWKSEDYDKLKEARAAMKSLATERTAILEKLAPIAVASRETLVAIGESARPKLGQWADDARTIGEQWWEKNKATLSPQAASAIGRLMQHRHDLAAMIEPKLRTKAAAARFMLWDGGDFTAELDRRLQSGGLQGLRELDLE